MLVEAFAGLVGDVVNGERDNTSGGDRLGVGEG